jgi:hypothetical protein
LADQFSPSAALVSLSIVLGLTAIGFLLSSSGVKQL